MALHSAATNVADFQVFVGLDIWRRVSAAANGGRGKMLYEWTPGPGPGVRKPIVRSGCRFALDPVTWRVTFPYLGSGECNGIELSGTPNTDFFSHNQNATWSAVDVDNDGEPNGTCADGRGSPFWYPTCRGGGIAGFGPHMNGYRFLHGAHWVGGANSFGTITTGQGSGDGWLYVR